MSKPSSLIVGNIGVDTSVPQTNADVPKSSTVDIAVRAGSAVRQFFNDHGMKLLVALVVVAISYIVVMSFSQMAQSDAIMAQTGMLRTAIVSANSLRHNKCKRRGACSKDCPFINEQDPRVVICKHADEVELVYSESVRSNEELTAQIKLQYGYFPETDAELKPLVESSIKAQDQAVLDIKEIHDKITDLDADAAKWKTLDSLAINAKERSIGLLNAANCESFKLTANALKALGNLFVKRISSLEGTPSTSKIAEYEKLSSLAKSARVTLDGQADSIISEGSKTEYNSALTNLKTEANDSNVITSAMAYIHNTHTSLVKSIKDLVLTFSRIANYFNGTIGMLEEGFNNKNPGDELSADSQTSMIFDGDYNSVMVKTALGKDLVKNHSKFTSQRSSFDSGGGVPSLRDDDNDLIPWAGFRRPQYFKKNGESMDKSAEPLRQIPSDVPQDMARLSFYDIIAPVKP